MDLSIWGRGWLPGDVHRGWGDVVDARGAQTGGSACEGAGVDGGTGSAASRRAGSDADAVRGVGRE